ncbi:hypothetical protein GCM10012275_09940 [Longimycelium tulufanense]|uniref:Uncharacterized protein n=1 Tax=Longimycelium tulufanense TaxID=907463 RepID=A0A8J3C6M8_9PSEU|nr:hypothetical protein [Longimycelium tulufanense]GGM40976.1 hypothetical protein GCM10012275_09940 [Longimycelium tulufanense]
MAGDPQEPVAAFQFDREQLPAAMALFQGTLDRLSPLLDDVCRGLRPQPVTEDLDVTTTPATPPTEAHSVFAAVTAYQEQIRTILAQLRRAARGAEGGTEADWCDLG